MDVASDKAAAVDSIDFQLRTRIIRGNGTIDQLGNIATELGANRVLVVSDPGIVKAGHSQHGLDSLRAVGLNAVLFDGAHENPSTDDVGAGVAFAKEHRPDLIVGLGGGSSMDCAKGINFLYSCGGEMKDYWGVGKATGPMLPMIAVPTTAGTGSEMQSFALITDAETNQKMACGDKRAACRVALLDPELTLTQPANVTALSGIDALSHALETFVTTKRNPISLMYSRESWRLIAINLSRVLKSPDDLDARAGMQLGASFAGVAIENSMLGASHALANPLTASFGTSHGQAVGLMLQHVIRFNGASFDHWYRDLLESTRDIDGAPNPDHGFQGLSDFVTELLIAAGLQTTLKSCGVDKSTFAQLALDAAEQWTGKFNPRKVDQASLLAMYESAY